MNHNFTERLRQWLALEPAQRDYHQGAVMLLQLSGNKVLFRNISSDPDKHAAIIEYQLQKYLDFRVRELTHEQVELMQIKVDKIVADNVDLAVKAEVARKNRQKGKRPDHEDLPEEIRQLYVDNLAILHKIRDLHLKLRSLSLDDATCPDSERYPFLKEIIALDKKIHANWKKYDSYEA